jgi:hypothetical protein
LNVKTGGAIIPPLALSTSAIPQIRNGKGGNAMAKVNQKEIEKKAEALIKARPKVEAIGKKIEAAAKKLEAAAKKVR